MTDEEFRLMRRVMIDIESLGGDRGKGSIVQIGAVQFDCTSTKVVVPGPTGVVAIDASTESAMDKPDIYDRLPSLLVNITIGSNMRHGFSMTGKTIAWWMGEGRNAPSDAARAWLFDPAPVTMDDALHRLRAFVDGAQEVWAYPNSFDLTYIESAYEAVGSYIPWKNSITRDARTVRFLLDDPQVDYIRYGERHHALWDACVQTTFLRRALVRLRGRKDAYER